MFYIKKNNTFKRSLKLFSPQTSSIKEDKQKFTLTWYLFHWKNNTFKCSLNLFVSPKSPTFEKANKNLHQHVNSSLLYIKTHTDMVVGLCFMSKLFKNFFSSEPGPTLLFLIMDSTKFPILGSI